MTSCMSNLRALYHAFRNDIDEKENLNQSKQHPPGSRNFVLVFSPMMSFLCKLYISGFPRFGDELRAGESYLVEVTASVNTSR